MIDIIRTKIIGLTMELNLKAKEFNILCNKLEQLKKKNIDANDERLLEIKKLFINNNEDILLINKKINELKKEMDEKNIQLNNIFENQYKQNARNIVKNGEVQIIKRKETLIYKIIMKIKKWFIK